MCSTLFPISRPAGSLLHECKCRDVIGKVEVIENDGCKEKSVQKDVEFFAWEKLDYVNKIKASFNI